MCASRLWQAQTQEQKAELHTHTAALAALLVRLAQRDADLAQRDARVASLEADLARAGAAPSPGQATGVQLSSPPEQAAAEEEAPAQRQAAAPRTPSKDHPPGPPRAPGDRSPCADPALAAACAALATATGARKRLRLADDASRQAGSAAAEPEKRGRLSGAASLDAGGGELLGRDDTSGDAGRGVRGLGGGRYALADRTRSEAAGQLPPVQLLEKWKLLAAAKSEPLTICADCGLPPTPEKVPLAPVKTHISLPHPLRFCKEQSSSHLQPNSARP